MKANNKRGYNSPQTKVKRKQTTKFMQTIYVLKSDNSKDTYMFISIKNKVQVFNELREKFNVLQYTNICEPLELKTFFSLIKEKGLTIEHFDILQVERFNTKKKCIEYMKDSKGDNK